MRIEMRNALRRNDISDWARRRPNIRRSQGYAATWCQPSEGAKRRPTNKTEATSGAAQEWEKLMWNYQQALPSSKPGEKWRLMDKIFSM